MSVKCINGGMDGGSHEFNTPLSAGTDMEPLLYCQRCGEVRKLELSPPDDGPLNLATADDLKQIAQNAADYPPHSQERRPVVNTDSGQIYRGEQIEAKRRGVTR